MLDRVRDAGLAGKMVSLDCRAATRPFCPSVVHLYRPPRLDRSWGKFGAFAGMFGVAACSFGRIRRFLTWQPCICK